jgi:ATP-dependent Lon protease
MFITTRITLRMPRRCSDRAWRSSASPATPRTRRVADRQAPLLAKQLKGAWQKQGEWHVSEDAVRDLVRYYTREAGVRNLEREIANLARKSIKEILMKNLKKVSISRRNLGKFAGCGSSATERRRQGHGGRDTGLAWTDVGGEILTIEAVPCPARAR